MNVSWGVVIVHWECTNIEIGGHDSELLITSVHVTSSLDLL